MPIFQKSDIVAQCDKCRARFDPVHGGFCEGCGRMLCDTHYYGGGVRALLRFVGTKTLCPECRARGVRGETTAAQG
ncbi:MAG TPA: hypothetical protein VFS05_02105 [Gemmatimonadaceae bacterium]|nr:hypothetical protein [Gemmatimonadaceae bacterium]